MTFEEYKKSPQMIGFMREFPVVETTESFNISAVCRNIPVEFKVHLCKLGFGDDNKYSCRGIVTEPIDISKHLFLGGWNSYSHIDEVNTMREAIVKLCELKGLTICREVCSWPFGKVILL